MCLYNNSKRAHLISATSLPTIAFQKSKCIKVFFLEVLIPEKHHSQYYVSILLLCVCNDIYYCSVLFYSPFRDGCLSNLLLALQVYFASMEVHRTLREY